MLGERLAKDCAAFLAPLHCLFCFLDLLIFGMLTHEVPQSK